MQYLLCPRCKFKVQANRHLCSTCGGKIPTVSQPKAVNSDALADKAQKVTFWQQFLRL